MDTIVFIGGMGSNRPQVEAVGDELSAYYDQPVQVFSFRDALQNTDKIKELTRGAHVITHAAGMLLLAGMRPREVVAIAPPTPTSPSTLLLRSIPKTMYLFKQSQKDSNRRKKVSDYHKFAALEHGRYPHYNIAKLSMIGKFDAFKAATALAKNGAAITLAFMQDDLLFFNIARSYFGNEMQERGIQVRIDVPGEHDEFLLYPVEVLKSLTLK